MDELIKMRTNFRPQRMNKYDLNIALGIGTDGNAIVR
jgi:hypothetical protein